MNEQISGFRNGIIVVWNAKLTWYSNKLIVEKRQRYYEKKTPQASCEVFWLSIILNADYGRVFVSLAEMKDINRPTGTMAVRVATVCNHGLK